MIFPPAIYDKLKFVVLTVLPAFSTLYYTLSSPLSLPGAEQVVVTCAALATFLGALIGVSAKAYKNSDEKYDGVAEFDVNEDGKPTLEYKFNEYPEDLVGKSEVVLKVQNRADTP